MYTGNDRTCSVGFSSKNKPYNRFQNITVCMFISITNRCLMSYLSTDDDNRIILKSLGNYDNDYINASPIDVSLIHYILYNIHIVC